MSLNRYDIRSKISEGGVGATYRAFDRNLDRVVAIKRDLADGRHEKQFERPLIEKRIDLHAMGCDYYHCPTGPYPFDRESPPQVMTAHFQYQVTPVSELRPDLPGWLNDWVMWHISSSMNDCPADVLKTLKNSL